MDNVTDRLRRIDTPEGPILAWDCPCGEEVRVGEDQWAIVRWDKPALGIEHSICHQECLEKELEDE